MMTQSLNHSCASPKLSLLNRSAFALFAILWSAPTSGQALPVQGPTYAQQSDVQAALAAANAAQATANAAATPAQVAAAQAAAIASIPNSLPSSFSGTTCTGCTMVNPAFTGTPTANGGNLVRNLWTSLSTQAITSSGEQSCFSATGSGPGQTLAANSAYVGELINVHCTGTYTTPTANLSTLTNRIKFGATTIATAVSGTLPVSLSGTLGFDSSILCRVVAVGASGSVSCAGRLTYDNGLSGVSLLSSPIVGTAGVDFTQPQKIDATGQFGGTITGSPTVTSMVARMTVLN